MSRGGAPCSTSFNMLATAYRALIRGSSERKRAATPGFRLAVFPGQAARKDDEAVRASA